MNTRDIVLSIVAVVAILATAWLLHDGTGPDAIAPIIALGGVALGRISGANAAPAAVGDVLPPLDAND